MAATEPPLLEPLSAPTTRTDLVMQAIKESILSNKLAEGEPLVERDLATRLGVSKTPVREALIALIGTGLVTAHANRRITVSKVTPQAITEVHELRLLLEPEAMVKAVERWNATLSKEADGLLAQATSAASEGRWADLTQTNRRFHQLLYLQCGNELLIRTLDNLQDRIALMSVRNWEQRPTWEKEMAEHRGILDAIEAGDVDLVRERAAHHISQFPALRDTLTTQDGENDSGA